MKHKPLSKYKLDLNETYREEDKGFASVDCPSCNDSVSADDININDKIAKCTSCNVVFTLDKVIGDLNQSRRSSSLIGRPTDVEKFYFEDELDLTIQQSASFFEIFFSIFMPFIAFAFLGGYADGGVPALVPIIVGLISVGFIINLISMKRQKRHIRVSNQTIDVWHKPKKLSRDVSFKINEIDQVYVYSYKNSSSKIVFGLKLVVNEANGQTHKDLVKDIRNIRNAKYLEQEIENHLSIDNKKMLEEV